jgi:hypothetical protein
MVSRSQVFSELADFLNAYAESVHRVFGSAMPVPEDFAPQESRLWSTVDLAFRFGVEGSVSLSEFNMGLGDGSLNPDVTDADMFFHGLSAMQMKPFMQEDLVRFPTACAKVIEVAIARHVLHGGHRDIAWEAELPAEQYLSIGEIALLANMDEGSVRNAASKAAGDARLVTEQFGKRSFVEISIARAWLAGRKGFVPTMEQGSETPSIQMSPQTLHVIASRAREAGMNVDDFVRAKLLAV